MENGSAATIMDGSVHAEKILETASRRATAFRIRTGRSPCLAAILVGDDPASLNFVNMKRERCQVVGMEARIVQLPADSTTDDVVDMVRRQSSDPTVDGILVQYPVPSQIDERAAIEAIAPHKDVDGVTSSSFTALSHGLPGFVPCAAAGILRLLDEYGVDPSGKHAVVIGRSPSLGRPLGVLLLGRDATVTFCDPETMDLATIVRTADIVVASAGHPHLVRGGWLKQGAVVIDAGYHQGRLGDVHFEEALHVASLIAPVPGGVGPMTIAVLLDHTVTAAEGPTWPSRPTPPRELGGEAACFVGFICSDCGAVMDGSPHRQTCRQVSPR